MENNKRREPSQPLTGTSFPWIPNPADVPPLLLQSPHDDVSDWISPENLCDVCSGLTFDAMRPGGYQHRTAKDLESVAGAAVVRDGHSCCPLCVLIWRRMRDHYVYYYPDRDTRGQVGWRAALSHEYNFARWADWEAWHQEGVEVDVKGREKTFAQLMSQNDDHIVLKGGIARIDIVHQASIKWAEAMEPRHSERTRVALHRDFLCRALTLYTFPDAPSESLFGHHIPWKNLEQAAKYAARWMQCCLQNHASCSKDIESPLPKRLVDVGRPGTSEIPRLWINPSLVQGQQEDISITPIRGTYLALSYCWRSKQFFNTNPQNLEEMKAEIPVKSIPRTIKDAIEFTRIRGVQYLWVDSLCILQGDSEEAKADWNEESVKMKVIYRNALLTIGAAAGKDAFHGIQPGGDEPEMPFCSLPKGFDESIMPGQIYASLQMTAERDDAIHTRAWTYQEFLLSARYINLGNPSIYWYCKQRQHDQRCGTKPVSYPPIPLSIGLTYGFLRLRPYLEWHFAIQQYTSRALTKPEDRLVAIAGVAADVWARKGKQDRYLLGLWKNSLIWDLCWRVRGGPTTGTLSDLLPSWSWASVDGPVDFLGSHGRCSKDCARVLDYHDNHELDQSGGSAKGSIRLEAWTEIRSFRAEDNGNRFSLKRAEHGIGLAWLDRHTSLERLLASASPTTKQFEMLCLLVHENQWGLLISPVCQERNTYMRIGCFQLHRRDVFNQKRCEIELV